MKRLLPLVFAVLAGLLGETARGLVAVTDHPARVQQHAGKERRIKAYTFASDIATYTLTADYSEADEPGRISSHWWAWTTGLVPIGMTEPSQANWYFQAFFNWTFDDFSLHDQAFSMEVVRAGGTDGMVAYVWDTPTVRATLRFAMVTGSDKLLLFADYEPRVPVQRSRLLFTCYPTGFVQPRNRAITTANGTTLAPANVALDLGAERWVLYEDLTAGRPGAGPCGMLVGTPENLAAAHVSVGTYAVSTHLEFRPEARSLALGLYEFPALPDLEATRAYFRATADLQAQAIGALAAGDLAQALPPLPEQGFRREQIAELGRGQFERPAETWRPDPEALSLPWARRLPGGPIRTALFVPRAAAFETMELARRLDLDVQHLYTDRANAMISNDAWPYFGNTGVGALPQSAVSSRAAQMAGDAAAELFVCAALDGVAVPPLARQTMVDQVAQGKGLLLAGGDEARNDWPGELFRNRDRELEARLLAGLDWRAVPGFLEGDPGRLAGGPVQCFRHGRGRVVHYRAAMHRYSAIVPRTKAREGLEGAMDRALALFARAAMAAAGRMPAVEVTLAEPAGGANAISIAVQPDPPPGSRLLIRVQDAWDRILYLETLPLPAGHVAVPAPAAEGAPDYVDAVVVDAGGHCLGYGFMARTAPTPFGLQVAALEPAARPHPEAPVVVALPQGGSLSCTVRMRRPEGTGELTLRGVVRDAHDRVLARAETVCPAGSGQAALALSLPRPLTVSHSLDLELLAGARPVAFHRERFTLRPPYPLDDFTVLMWSYAGAPPVLRRTDRLCFAWGADMMDLCHMGGYSAEAAAREYDLSSRSGLRLLPYVTRLAGSADAQHRRQPGLREPEAAARTRDALRTTCAQAAPYAPVAYTLGDENYLLRGDGEVCHRPESVAAFQVWLQGQYGTIAALNRTWGTDHLSFEAIAPPLLADAAAHTASLAPWIDHKRFMDEEFALAHERFAEVIHEVDPGALVGWDGFLGHTWRSGYDFARLTAHLRLNQTYTSNWPQGEFVRSFKQPGALTGMWGNATADTEDGWRAFPWACLLQGDNSVWWWTSWGLEYIPFNPDLSRSLYGTWFFDAVRELKDGIGRLLLRADRDARIAVLYSQPDLFALTIAQAMAPDCALGGDRELLREYAAAFRAILDAGSQFEAVTAAQVASGRLQDRRYDAVWLCRAVTLADGTVAALAQFVRAGGTLIVDGGAGLLDERGAFRPTRPLDGLLGVAAPVGLDALRTAPKQGEVRLAGALFGQTVDLGSAAVSILEPGLRVAGGQPLAEVDGTPLLVAHRVDKGRTLTLNLSLHSLGSARQGAANNPFRQLADAILAAADVAPYCRLETLDELAPRCLWQVRFDAGPNRYLALQQDFEVRGLAPQSVRLTLPDPAIVYDVRAGRRVGNGPVQTWETQVGRGDPRLFALLPAAVAAIRPEVPPDGRRGGTLPLRVTLHTDGAAAGYHVVRLDVYAPGSSTPHRLYSQNLDCPGGQGGGDIPFALDDPPGQWRLAFRDVASGVRTEAGVELR